MMIVFLRDLSKKYQCRLKFKNTINRVLMAQKKFRMHVHARMDRQAKLMQSTMAGLNTLRMVLIKDKTYQVVYKEIVDAINAITAAPQSLVSPVIDLHLDLPAYIHSVNILRWYAVFRNNGVYNTDLYFALFAKVKQVKDQLKRLLAEGEHMLPSRQALAGPTRPSFRRSISAKATQVGSLFAKLDDNPKDEEPDAKQLLQRRITNLFSFALPKSLPAILPKVLDPAHADFPLSEEVVQDHFEDMGIELEELS